VLDLVIDFSDRGPAKYFLMATRIDGSVTAFVYSVGNSREYLERDCDRRNERSCTTKFWVQDNPAYARWEHENGQSDRPGVEPAGDTRGRT
jgi:hypothetical protein